MRTLAVVTGTLVMLVAGATPTLGQFQPPQCELNTGHFLVNGAMVYLKGAAAEEDSAKSAQMLTDARRNLVEAVTRGEEENPAVWYFLGRYYEAVGDAAGVDSTFRRAADLAPDCREDIDYHRQVMWVPRVNRGIEQLRAGDFEEAKASFREADIVWDRDPIAPYYLGRIFGNEGEADSAISYFRQVVSMEVSDTARAEQVRDAHYSTGILYMMLAQRNDAEALWDSTLTWLESYLEEYPDDPEAMVTLSQAYDQAGRTEQAMAMYDRILGRAADMEAAALFEVGTKMFRAQNFEVAARAFEAGLERNPYNRDGLFNLANTYLVLEDAGKMLEAVRRLLRLDPQNREGVRLLAGAHQLASRPDSTLVALQQAQRMRWEVSVDFSEKMQTGFGISGRIRNFTNREVQAPTITFEFLDLEGNVVGTDSIGAQSLDGNAEAGFELMAADTSVVGWRYKVGS